MISIFVAMRYYGARRQSKNTESLNEHVSQIDDSIELLESAGYARQDPVKSEFNPMLWSAEFPQASTTVCPIRRSDFHRSHICGMVSIPVHLKGSVSHFRQACCSNSGAKQWLKVDSYYSLELFSLENGGGNPLRRVLMTNT